MTVSKNCPDQDLKIKLAVRMDKPQNMKHSGSPKCLPFLLALHCQDGLLEGSWDSMLFV
ncbi:hypothetical protein A6R68_13730, partial [Neotoma lepida]